MSSTPDAIFYRREFLNEEGHHGLAAVLAEIKEGDQNEDYVDFGATLQISDCNRSVTLDFGVFGTANNARDLEILRADLANAYEKAMRLMNTVDLFMDALEEGLTKVGAELDKREKQQSAKKDKKKRKKAHRKAVALAEKQEA